MFVAKNSFRFDDKKVKHPVTELWYKDNIVAIFRAEDSTARIKEYVEQMGYLAEWNVLWHKGVCPNWSDDLLVTDPTVVFEAELLHRMVE